MDCSGRELVYSVEDIVQPAHVREAYPRREMRVSRSRKKRTIVVDKGDNYNCQVVEDRFIWLRDEYCED